MYKENHLHTELPARSENEGLARTICAAFALELDPTVEEMTEIKTAVSEAVTNAIIHAYKESGGTIIIDCVLSDNELTYTIEDSGCGISDIAKAKEPLFSGSGDPERSGMGFSIMEAFTDGLRVESTVGRGTRVVMKKRISKHEK